MEQVIWITVPVAEIQAWFRRVANTQHDSWYESSTRSFVTENAAKIAGETPLRVWIELKLGTEEDKDTRSPDVIIETAKRLWIVEVKDRRYQDALEDADRQVRDYSQRIHDLRWWPAKEHKSVVFWSYVPSDEKGRKLTPWQRTTCAVLFP